LFKLLNRFLVQAVSRNHISVINWIAARSLFLTHRHDELLAFVSIFTRASSAAFRVARAFSRSHLEFFPALRVSIFVRSRFHQASLLIVSGYFHAMAIEAVLDLRLVALANRVWAFFASIWAVFETGTTLETV